MFVMFSTIASLSFCDFCSSIVQLFKSTRDKILNISGISKNARTITVSHWFQMGQTSPTAKSAREPSRNWRTSTMRLISLVSVLWKSRMRILLKNIISDLFLFSFTIVIKFQLFTNVSTVLRISQEILLNFTKLFYNRFDLLNRWIEQRRGCLGVVGFEQEYRRRRGCDWGCNS